MKILLVEDERMTQKAISQHLRQKGHQVIVTDDGIKAIEILKTEKTDLIISDIMMPVMSGLAFLSLLKQFYFIKTPVIIISSISHINVVTKSLRMGAEEFILKPLDFYELIQKIKKYEC